MATLATMRPMVRHKIGLPSTDKTVSDDKVNRDINIGLQKMAADFDWPWLEVSSTFTLAPGTHEFTPPTGVVKILWVSDMTYTLPSTQRRDIQLYSDLTGPPRMYSASGGKITVYPAPIENTTLAYSYVSSEVPLVTDSDVALCPDQFIDIANTYAALEYATRKKDPALRTAFKEEIQEWKRRAADVNKSGKGTYKPQIGRRW